MNKTILAVIIIVVVGAGSFYAGTKVKGRASTPNFSQFGGGQMRPGQGGMRGVFGEGTFGEIISKDDTSITVKLADGGSRIVLLSSTTTVNKTTAGSKDDLVTGEQVMVAGDVNSDGSINARSIQIGSGIQMFGRQSQGQQTPQ